MDLTPYYGFEEDARAFPRDAARRARRPSAPSSIRSYKKWCDEYFFLQAPQRAARHRRHLLRRPGGAGLRRAFALVRSVGDHFSPPTRRSSSAGKAMPYGERERGFQAYRRGRYVEFNLVYDRGTLFGLQSGGRTESILMSLPPAPMALRLEARAGLARGEALQRLPQAAGLGLNRKIRDRPRFSRVHPVGPVDQLNFASRGLPAEPRSARRPNAADTR